MNSLTAIVPFYNEETFIEKSVNRLLNIDLIEKIILVDDASTDRSTDIAKNISKIHKNIIYKRLPVNSGKGNAISHVKSEVTTTHIIIHDADLEYFPEDIVEMFELAKKNENSLILGSRFKGNKERKNIYKRTYFANKLMSFFFSIVHNYKVSDIATCYKLFPQNFFTSVNFVEKGFSIEIEIISKFLKYNKSIVESPIRYEGRSYSEGKKIKLLDGVYYLLNTIKYKFIS